MQNKMVMLKLGSTGPDVVKLQKALKIKADGSFGPATKRAVIRFQLNHNITPDGIVGNETWTLVLSKAYSNEAIDEDSDISAQYFTTPFGQIIHKNFLPKDEYVQQQVKNQYIFLHHTAGRENPYKVIDQWDKDSRGKIGTEFVLGGQSHTDGSDKYDGVMIQAFPEGNYAWHLGATGSGHMNKASVGLEICSMGHLDKDFKTYIGSTVIESQRITLKEAFRGRLHFHNYSEKQIKETEKWIRYVAQRDNIDVRIGLQQWIKKYGPTKAFDFQEDAYYGNVKGLLTHTNVRKDKMDCYPHPDLIDMIMSL